jgi:hydrogenase nickel incorporation protein HypA/HybF
MATAPLALWLGGPGTNGLAGGGCYKSCLFPNVHEIAVMDGALQVVLDEAHKAGATRVYTVCLRIGTLSGVVPDALRVAFDALSPGTLADGANLVIDEVTAKFWCNSCAREFTAADRFAECPDCRQPSADLRAGREMEISSLEIE